jgi:hypothetical protein
MPIHLAISGGLPQCRLAAMGTTPELPSPTATVIVNTGSASSGESDVMARWQQTVFRKNIADNPPGKKS